MDDANYNCLYPTASSSKGLQICSPRVGFSKYFEPENEKRSLSWMLPSCSTECHAAPKVQISPLLLSGRLLGTERNVHFSEVTNAKHRIVYHELMTYCGSCPL